MLNIETKKNNGELLIAVEGRLDTKTAPELEATVNDNIEGVEKLIFDFTNLVYISSAGLRVLLSSHKRMLKQGDMVIKNVPEEVVDTFEITGFADILTIE
ncbi:MAG: STAS domain-containing protein [Clostridia bacterium]|nr:STAS domain-containing protein [Clostridia bacterium]MBQ3462329.1 STAS domain-containing protein [Clostridia bacterium]